MRQSKQPKVKRVFSARQIAKRIDALGEAIRADAGAGEVFLLGLLKGATCFLADLMRAIPGDVAYGYIDVIRDIADTVNPKRPAGPSVVTTLTVHAARLIPSMN